MPRYGQYITASKDFYKIRSTHIVLFVAGSIQQHKHIS